MRYLIPLLMLFYSLTSFSGDYDNTIDFLKGINNWTKIEDNFVGFAEANIKRGLKLLDVILDGKYVSNPDTASKDMVSVMWGLYHLSGLKDLYFEYGTYIIEDKNQYLFNFFKSHPYSYKRMSTHLKHLTKKTDVKHYGVDVLGEYTPGEDDWKPCLGNVLFPTLFAQNYTQLHLLPTHKSTVLFIPMLKGNETLLDENHILIKPETNGLATWKGLYNHALDWMHMDKATFEKMPIVREERVDRKLLSNFLNIVNEGPALTKEELGKVIYLAQELGVRYMISYIETHQLTKKRSTQKLFQLFERRNNDHLRNRMANEVYFSENELKQMVQ